MVPSSAHSLSNFASSLAAFGQEIAIRISPNWTRLSPIERLGVGSQRPAPVMPGNPAIVSKAVGATKNVQVRPKRSPCGRAPHQLELVENVVDREARARGRQHSPDIVVQAEAGFSARHSYLSS